MTNRLRARTKVGNMALHAATMRCGRVTAAAVVVCFVFGETSPRDTMKPPTPASIYFHTQELRKERYRKEQTGGILRGRRRNFQSWQIFLETI
jgi:hypothetical protein